MFSFITSKPKLLLAIILAAVFCFMGLRIYQLNTKVSILVAEMGTLETEKTTLQERLDISNANNEILKVDVTALKDHMAEVDRECEARVARASSKTKIIEKRTYIPKQDAVNTGVLDEDSSKMLLEYLGTHIFN